MVKIKIRIKFPSFRKEKKREVEKIQFSETKNFIEELRNKNEISEYYGKLKGGYDNFMEELQEVENALNILEKEGEKTFTSAVGQKLEKIEGLNEFNVSSFQEFYTDTFHIIQGIVKISPRAQRHVLKYENGKETIELLNSFLKRLRDLKEILANRYSEYSIVNHFENAIKKQEEIEGSKKKVRSLEKRIESIRGKKENKKESLEEKNKKLEEIKSGLDQDKIKKLKDEVESLKKDIRKINSELKTNLSIARRPISKILHSAGNKKIFDFFREEFKERPLENIDEKFWKMINIVKSKDIELGEIEKENLNDFLTFVENELKNKILESKNLEKEKKKLEQELEDISSKNKKLLKKAKYKKEKAEKEFSSIKRKLESLKEKKNKLENKIRKNVKALEIMLSKVSENKIRIEI